MSWSKTSLYNEKQQNRQRATKEEVHKQKQQKEGKKQRYSADPEEESLCINQLWRDIG
jgi:hypothetical protein